MHFSDWAVLCWVCCITFNLWLLVIKKMNKIEFEKYEFFEKASVLVLV